MDEKPNLPPNLEMLLDVRVQLSIELGSCQMAMRDVLQLNPGAVAPVELYANHKRIARGEVVVADDCYGIKITELIGPGS
jgi:flagellar motor switch protein FliN/FliY